MTWNKAMADLSKHLNQDLIANIRYLGSQISVENRYLAEILELDEESVSKFMNNGRTGAVTSNEKNLSEKFYSWTALLSYLLKLANYDSDEFQRLWRNSQSLYESSKIRPPWYSKGLKDYLAEKKYEGLRYCVEWIITPSVRNNYEKRSEF